MTYGARTLCLALIMVAAGAGGAAANDSAAELAAGGLVLVKTNAVTMQREDLTLSPSEVRVRYEMRNDTGQPVTLRVAFPLPEVPSNSPDGMTVSTGTYNGIAIKPPTDPNFLDFHVSANQRALTPDIEIRAVHRPADRPGHSHRRLAPESRRERNPFRLHVGLHPADGSQLARPDRHVPSHGAGRASRLRRQAARRGPDHVAVQRSGPRPYRATTVRGNFAELRSQGGSPSPVHRRLNSRGTGTARTATRRTMWITLWEAAV